MKNPLKKTTAEPLRRQRARREQQETPAPSFSYYGRRSDKDVTTSRQSSQRSPLAGRAQEHIKTFWMQRFGLTILLIALLVSALNIITLSTIPKILPLTAGGILVDLRISE